MRLIVGRTIIALLVGMMGLGVNFQPVQASPARQGTPPSAVQAVVIVERASVFPTPDRLAGPISYLYERERAPVLAQTIDGIWLLTSVGAVQGWILRAQIELEGDPTQIPFVEGPLSTPTLTITPFPTSATAPNGIPSEPTLTPAPGLLVFTPTPAATAQGNLSGSFSEATGEMPVLPGAPPPIEITLPEDWQSIDLIVPYRTFTDAAIREVPLTIYSGPLPDGAQGVIYLYWGYPNTVDLITNEVNLWADGVQILRFSLIGPECNLGVYEERALPVGDYDGVGAFYQAAECPPEEADTAGWFTVVQLYGGGFAFYVAVEPPASLPSQRAFLQDILSTVKFLPPETE